MRKSAMRTALGESAPFADAVAAWLTERCGRRGGSGLTWSQVERTVGTDVEVVLEAPLGTAVLRIRDVRRSLTADSTEGYEFAIVDPVTESVIASTSDEDVVYELSEAAWPEWEQQMRPMRQSVIDALDTLS